MKDYNHVTLVGEVTNIANQVDDEGTLFILKVNRNKKDETESDYIPVYSYKNLADVVNENVNTGYRVLVDGKIKRQNGKGFHVEADSITILSPKKEWKNV